MAVKAYKHCTHCHNEVKLILKFKSHNTLDWEFETYVTVHEKIAPVFQLLISGYMNYEYFNATCDLCVT